MFKKSAVKLTVLILAMTLIIAACGGNNGNNNNGGNNNSTPPATNGGSPSGEGTAPNDVTISIAYATGDPATKEAMETTVAAFTEANPHITIVNISETTADSYLDWLRTKDAVGEFPDLVEIRDTRVFVEAGKIAELPEDLHDLFASLPEYEGKIYNAPINSSVPTGVIYSKKAYENAGITSLPETYDEFLEINQKLADSGISPIAVGGNDVWHMGFWVNKFLMDYVYAEDPDWNSKRTAKEVSFTDDNVVQAMTDFKELFQTYVDQGWMSTGDNQIASLLVTERAASFFSGPWMFTQVADADPDFEYGFYALPDRDGRTVVLGLPNLAGWSLSTEAAQDPDKVEAIKEFIRFFFEKDNYARFLQTFNAVPTTKEEIVYDAEPAMQEVLRLLNDDTVVKSLFINNWYGDNAIPPQFRDYFYKLLQELVLTDGDVVEYMRQADAQYDNDVQANLQ